MARFLAFLMIFAVTVAHGSSVTAAICDHQSFGDHVAARQSRDQKVAAVAIHEDSSAAASKKTSQGASTSIHWPAEMLPASLDSEPSRQLEAILFHPDPQHALRSELVPPLLEPPSA